MKQTLLGISYKHRNFSSLLILLTLSIIYDFIMSPP